MKTLRIVSADMENAQSLQTMLIRGKQFRVLPILLDGRELLERYMEGMTLSLPRTPILRIIC